MKKISLFLLTGFLGFSILSGCQSKSSSNDSVDFTDYTSTAEQTTQSPSDSIGAFTTTDIFGTTYTHDIFADYDLTLINIFATWCGPCVNEIPYLEGLYEEYRDKGVNIIGFVLDTADGKGNPIESAVEQAKTLADSTGATYPFLLPDATWLDGRLAEVTAVPTTIFVDRNGNVVGETYVGSRNLKQWKTIIEEELANLKREG